MADAFVKLLNMSITAGWVVLTVVILRALPLRIPKWARCLLWAAVAIRLVLPFSFESALSLIPSTDMIPVEITEADFGSEGAITVFDAPANEKLTEYLYKQQGSNVWDDLLPIAAWVWLAGMAAMVIYAAISYLRLRRRVEICAPAGDGTYVCDGIASPFIMGIAKPRIYLPSVMDSRYVAHVIAHERAHLRRLDHLWKPIGYLLLSVHWFNPLIWLAYVLLCRDIELACDERVIKDMGAEAKKAYSQALLSVSDPKQSVRVCPLAFGEVGVKARIGAVHSFRKPTVYVIILTAVICALVAVFLLTDPAGITLDRLGGIPHGDDVEYVHVSRGRHGNYRIYLDGEIDALLEMLSEVRAERREASADRSEDRDSTNRIIFYGANDREICSVNFDGELSLVWIDDGVKPTLSHRIRRLGGCDGLFDGSAKWTYSPGLSAAWHGMFIFSLPEDVVSTEVSCDGGWLYDLYGDQTGGIHSGAKLVLSGNDGICWAPDEPDTCSAMIYQASEAKVSFRCVF